MAADRRSAPAEIFNYCHSNKIFNVPDLNRYTRTLQSRLYSVGEELKKENRRKDTLKERLKHSYNFKKYSKINAQYEKLYSAYEAAQKKTGFFAKSNAQKALDAANEFHEANRPQLALYKNAEKYLRDVLQQRFDPKKLPIAKWEKELAELDARHDTLYREYCSIKDDTAKAEKMQRTIGDIQRKERQEPAPQKSQGMAL